MAFIDGAGTATWTGFRSEAYGIAGSTGLVITSPVNGNQIPASSVPIHYTVSTFPSGGVVDVQFQVATDAAFTSVVAAPSPSGVGEGPHVVNASGLPTNTTLYLRGRAAPTGTGSWGPWVGQPWASSASDTPHVLTGGAATASSQFDGTFGPAEAFDGIVGTTGNAWATVASGMPAWLQIDATTAIEVGAYQVAPRPESAAAGQHPTAWTLQGSDTGVGGWVTLDTRTAIAWVGTAPKRFELTVASTYRYYRMNITAINGDTNQIAAVAELSLYPMGSPVSAVPISFIVELNTSRAWAYIDANYGIDSNALTRESAVYNDANYGVPIEHTPRGFLYSDENIGAATLHLKEGYGYVEEGDVSTNVPVPHVWFLWWARGFAGDEVWAYGHGFGNPQGEYTGQLMINSGVGVPPVYTGADTAAGINEWYLKEAEPHAYDSQRTIYPGLDETPPRVDGECDIVRFLIPGSIVPDEIPTLEYIYVQHSGGVSNQVPWLMYPTLPTPAGNQGRVVFTETSLRLSADQVLTGIEQRLFHADPGDYVIAGGIPQRPPSLSASAVTGAALGTWSTEDALATALSVDLGATYRWLPDAADLTPRPDLGTGVVVWDPAVGTGSGWKLLPTSMPYIDPAYGVTSRLGALSVPAMVFPGDAFGELLTAVPAGPAFTVAMVVVLHENPNNEVTPTNLVVGRSTLMSTFRSVVNPAYVDWELVAEGEKVRMSAGAQLGNLALDNYRGRPVIVVASVSAGEAELLLVDGAPSSYASVRPAMESTGNKAYLARSGRAASPAIAAFELLDIAWWNTALSTNQMWSAASKLDGIYGVTG